jgi:putative transcriptional regulator
MTLTDLADRVGMTLANLSILKTGKARAIRFSTLDAICEALACQPGDILPIRTACLAEAPKARRRTKGATDRQPQRSGRQADETTDHADDLVAAFDAPVLSALGTRSRRGLEPGTVSAAGGLVILAVWLCGTLVFTKPMGAGHRSARGDPGVWCSRAPHAGGRARRRPHRQWRQYC